MNEIIKELQKRLKSKSQKELAKELGISQPYLSDIIKGNRGADEIAKKLGYQVIKSYKKIKL